MPARSATPPDRRRYLQDRPKAGFHARPLAFRGEGNVRLYLPPARLPCQWPRATTTGVSGSPHCIPSAGLCPKLGVHAAFAQPGQILVDLVKMPDGTAYLTVSRTLEGPQAGFNERVRRMAILIGCDFEAARETGYGEAAGLPGTNVLSGTACRLCERPGCLSRAEPPVTWPLGLDEMAISLSAFDFR